MNAKRLFPFCLSLLLSAPALSADRVLLDLDCSDRSLPALTAFAADAGIANPGQAYRARGRAWANAVRACHRGYDRVRVVVTNPRRAPALKLVRR